LKTPVSGNRSEVLAALLDAARQARHSRIRTHGAISTTTQSPVWRQFSQIPSFSVAIRSPLPR
jgi:hypothetical protein